jgi:hypothetical protein
MIGTDPTSGKCVVIAASRAAAERGSFVAASNIWFSPDEVATLIALDERAKKIAAVKAAFPGAETTEVRHVDNVD